ncbi:DUF6068 family protein [Cystobacter fuscus]|nr:DUF6068 family protein [Cystobacter fuscus]
MRMRFPFRASSLGMTLFLLAGCQSTKSGGLAPTPPETPTGTAPSAASPWQRARVGDAVTYTFSAQQGAAPGGTARSLRGLVSLEVVAVQQPWVWVNVSFTDEAGQPLAPVWLAWPQLLPVRSDVTRPIEVPPLGEPVAERPTVAGRAWDAQRFEKDSRPVDGPLVSRVYATEPGPLYLTRGLLGARTETAGFHVPGGSELTLRDFREGSSTASSAVPVLERPLGSGTYYDRRLEQGPTPTLTRVCFGAERGFLLRTEAPLDTQAAPCTNFAEAEPEPLEEVLTGLVWEAVAVAWPPATAAAGTRGTFEAEGHAVPALTAQRTENDGSTQRVLSETYAADPWSPTLAGLAREARFQPLAESTERVEKAGKRELEGGSRLVRWGSWLGGAK